MIVFKPLKTVITCTLWLYIWCEKVIYEHWLLKPSNILITWRIVDHYLYIDERVVYVKWALISLSQPPGWKLAHLSRCSYNGVINFTHFRDITWIVWLKISGGLIIVLVCLNGQLLFLWSKTVISTIFICSLVAIYWVFMF